MKIRKNGLDEMQKGKQNEIGHQMFTALLYLLLLDNGLYGFGVRWLNYPANTMVILVACAGVYLVRLIAANAYLPPKVRARRPLLLVVITFVLGAALAVAIVLLFGDSLPQSTENSSDNSAVILTLCAIVSLAIAGLTALIRRANNRNDEREG